MTAAFIFGVLSLFEICLSNHIKSYAAVSTEDSPASDTGNQVSIEFIEGDKNEDKKIPDNISMEFGYGFQNTAKSGRMLPFYVDFNNQGETDIDGRLIIEVTGSVEADRNEFEEAKVNYCFETKIPAGKTTKLQNTISIAETNSRVRLVLEDKNGNILCEKNTEVVFQQTAGAELLIGVLSESQKKLEYFKNLSIADTQLRTRTVNLEAESMPETASGLEQLDMIIVSDYDIEKLSAGTVEMLGTWTENGGIMLIGTGNDRETANTICEALVSELSIGLPSERAVNMGIEYSKTNPDDAVLRLKVCDIFAAGGIQVMQSDDIAMLTTVPVGNGIIGITAYDLCDISEFCTEEINYADDLLKSLIGSSRLTKLINSAKHSDRLYDKAESLVGIADPDRLPGAVPYILFCIAYLCLIAGLYIYLRMRGLSIFYHAFIPIVSFMSAIVLWLLSSGLRSDGISFDYAVMREIHDGYVMDEGFMKISSAALREYKLKVPAEYELHPIVHGARDVQPEKETALKGFLSFEEGTETDNLSEARIALKNSDTETYISASDMKPFAGLISEYSAKISDSGFEKIETNISIFGDEISGSIDNKTEYNLENAALIMYGRLIKLGNIRAGERKELEDCELMEYPVGDAAAVAEEITGVRLETPGTNNYVRALRRSRLFDYYISNSLYGYFSGARLVAFADGVDLMKDISSESRIESHGSMLISVQTEADFKKGLRSCDSCMSTEPKLVSGEYDAARNLTASTCVLEYTLGNDIDVNMLKFNRLSENFENEDIAVFTGNVLFYNYVTGRYDLMGENIYDGLSAAELAGYLSPGNTITVRYAADDTAGGMERLYLPVPYVTGTQRR